MVLRLQSCALGCWARILHDSPTGFWYLSARFLQVSAPFSRFQVLRSTLLHCLWYFTGFCYARFLLLGSTLAFALNAIPSLRSSGLLRGLLLGTWLSRPTFGSAPALLQGLSSTLLVWPSLCAALLYAPGQCACEHFDASVANPKTQRRRPKTQRNR